MLRLRGVIYCGDLAMDIQKKSQQKKIQKEIDNKMEE